MFFQTEQRSSLPCPDINKPVNIPEWAINTTRLNEPQKLLLHPMNDACCVFWFPLKECHKLENRAFKSHPCWRGNHDKLSAAFLEQGHQDGLEQQLREAHCTPSNCNTKHIRLLRTEQDAVLGEEDSYISPWRGKHTGFFSSQRFISSLQPRSSQIHTASAYSPISLVLLLPKIVLLFVSNHSWNRGYLYGLCRYALILEVNKIHREYENNLLLWYKIMKCSVCYLFCTRECLLLKTQRWKNIHWFWPLQVDLNFTSNVHYSNFQICENQQQ